jgi:pimeloyl-ACP methyl ester carboxylesterase
MSKHSFYACTLILLGFLMIKASCASEQSKEVSGTEGNFHGFTQYSFEVDGIESMIVVPKTAAKGKPWIWRARFYGHQPQFDIAMLERGYHLAYSSVANLYGSPTAVSHWNSFYDYLTHHHGFAKKAVLEGMSRGGLIVYNWAIQNPEKVSAIYADAPVVDFKSWPGINKKIMSVYGLTQQEAEKYQGNPIDNLKPLSMAGVPIIHVVGDIDKVVPVSENTAIIEQRYKALGGDIKVIHKKDVGHHPHSLKDPKPIVDFILKYSLYNE